MAYATQTAVSNGALTTLNVSIEYMYRSEISVYFGDALQSAGWHWADNNAATILFDSPVPNGTVVKLRRSTNVAEPFHTFSEGAMFDKANMDDNFKQVLHVAQEMQEGGGILIISPGGSGEANTTRNLGTGVGIAAPKSGVNLPMKSLKAGANITLTSDLNEITIAAAGGGSGGASPFAVITDFGAVGDFVPAAGSTGTGTNNDAAVNAAIASGKPLWIPAGNFLITWASQQNLQYITTTGPGTLWGSTNVGITKIGKMVSIGTTRSHELQSVGGLLLGGESGNGMRQWMGHHNWQQWQPTKYGAPAQIQAYPNVCCGLATVQAPNVLVATHGIFDTTVMAVGDHIGYGSSIYKITSFLSPTMAAVTKFDGSSPEFVTDTLTKQTFYHAYETATGICNTFGTSVTYVSGEQYPFGYGGDHMYAIIDGIRYTVTQGPESIDANHLTLGTSAGAKNNVSIQFRRCWGYFAYVSMLRLQGLGGGVETNCGMYLNIRNEAVVFNSGYGSTYFGDMRINARKIYLGQGDGTGGTEFIEVGADYLKTKTGKVTLMDYVKARNTEVSSLISNNSYAINAEIKAPSGSNFQVVPGVFHGHSMGGTGTVWGCTTEAWTGDQTTGGVSSTTLCALENGVFSQYHNQVDRVIGTDNVFKNRPDDLIGGAVRGGLGANRYNANSIAYWVTSQPRSTAGEYCGWNRGLQFDANSLDASADGRGIGVDFVQVNKTRVDCMKFPDGSVQNSGQGVWRAYGNKGTDGYGIVNVSLQNLKVSTVNIDEGGVGTFSAATQRFTFAQSGTFHITGTAMFDCTTAGSMVGYLYIRKNGSNADADSLKTAMPFYSLSAGQVAGGTVSGLMKVVAGDYIIFHNYLSISGAWAVTTNAQAITSLDIHRVA